VINDPERLSVSVCDAVMRLRCANMAERIDVLFGMETPGDARNIVLDGVFQLLWRGKAGIRCGLHQITLATC